MVIMGFILLVTSLLFIISGVLGLFRLPDFYTKIHAASVVECCGAPMFLIGLACLQNNLMSGFKLVLAAVLLWLLSPVSGHVLGKMGVEFMHKSSNNNK